MNTSAGRVIVGLIVFLLAAQMWGCAQDRRGEGLSQRVEFLWQQHPNPHPEAGARRAAVEARTLLADHDDDIELHFYYQDRLRGYEPDSLRREYQRRLDRDPNNAVNIILEASVRKSGPYLVQVMDAALELDSTTAEVLAYGVIAMMGSRPADTVKAFDLADAAITLHPGSYQAHISKARVERGFGSMEIALEHAKIASELNPWNFESVSLHYSILKAEDREDEAIALMQEFFYSQPTHIPSYKQLLRYHNDREDWDEIFKLEMIISPAYPENGYALFYAADAAYKAGDTNKIFDAYEKAAEYGFFDIEYALKMMSGEERHSFEQNHRYNELMTLFDANHEAARPERLDEALNRPLNIEIHNFSARDLHGRTVNLEDHRGKVIVIDFWSTVEPNHKLMVPRLKALREKYPEVELISVSVLERIPSDKLLKRVTDRAEDQGMDWTVWVGDDELARRMRVRNLPTFGVIDADGYARYRVQGYHAFIDEILGYLIDAAMLPRLEDQVNAE